VSPIRSTRLRVVVDGSNFATEGRVTPSLAQLDEAVRAFIEEHPNAEIIVVADASFEHRVAPNERAHFKAAELAGEIVTPPAGAIGRGDAFILKIADRIKGVVLSNDSFQEFHDEYPWLFDEGRLIGGKPVKGVGWVFTPRLPVRNTKTTRPVKKLSVTLSGGAKPSIGTTLTPVKPAKVKKASTKVAKASPKAAPIPTKVAPTPTKVTPAPTKEKRSLKVDVAKVELAEKKTAKALKKSPAKVAKAPLKPKKVANATVVTPPPAVALRRGRHPVNPEADFALFRSAHRIGSRVEGEVTDFTSHGAVIKVALKSGQLIECYAPTTSLGTPAPARARDVLKRGDRRTFRLVAVDAERRIAELALL
jgi:Zc3h12a-like ribonuclease protein